MKLLGFLLGEGLLSAWKLGLAGNGNTSKSRLKPGQI